VLSEHETRELLEQLKHGVLPGTTADLAGVDTIGHWPVLIADGLCLNLQSVAALELNRQPETILVDATGLETVRASNLRAEFNRIHYLRDGVDGNALIVGYDRNFSSMLAVLQETDFNSGTDDLAVQFKDNSCTAESEFTRAIAASIDAEQSGSGQQVTPAVLTSDFGELSLGGSWRLQLKFGKLQSELFIGWCETSISNSIPYPARMSKTFSICVKAENVRRESGSNALIATLAEPEFIHVEKTETCGSYSMNRSSVNRSFEEFDLAFCSPHRASRGRPADDALLVHKLLQLSVDDLYLLLVEAIGRVAALTFRFELNASNQSLDPWDLLQNGGICRCLYVNELPIRYASLTVADGKVLLESRE